MWRLYPTRITTSFSMRYSLTSFKSCAKKTINHSNFTSAVKLHPAVSLDLMENYYRPQRSWAKVMFLQASVILSTGGSLPQCMLGCQPPSRPGRPPWTRQTPPGPGRHPRTRQTPPRPGRHPPDQADTPWTRQTASPRSGRHPPRGRCQHTVNEWPVCILLECILVSIFYYSTSPKTDHSGNVTRIILESRFKMCISKHLKKIG